MKEEQSAKEITSVVKEERVNRRYPKSADYAKNALFCFLVTVFGKQKFWQPFRNTV